MVFQDTLVWSCHSVSLGFHAVRGLSEEEGHGGQCVMVKSRGSVSGRPRFGPLLSLTGRVNSGK